MSVSLKYAYSVASGCLKDGWNDESIANYMKRICTSQGEFVPDYNGKSTYLEPRICYNFKDKVSLSKENKRKLGSIARQFDLLLDFDNRNKIARISEKRRIGKKEVIKITEKPERISVTSPKTIINSEGQYESLLESVGEVFGVKG